MHDFSKRYRGVVYFGLWAEESAHDFGRRDALAIVDEAAGRCFEEDIRQDAALLDALAYLTAHGGVVKGVSRFRKALDEPNAAMRFRAVADALKAMHRQAQGL